MSGWDGTSACVGGVQAALDTPSVAPTSGPSRYRSKSANVTFSRQHLAAPRLAMGQHCTPSKLGFAGPQVQHHEESQLMPSFVSLRRGGFCIYLGGKPAMPAIPAFTRQTRHTGRPKCTNADTYP